MYLTAESFALSAIIGAAEPSGIDSEAYLLHVLTRIADYPINHIAELLPWNDNLVEATSADE